MKHLKKLLSRGRAKEFEERLTLTRVRFKVSKNHTDTKRLAKNLKEDSRKLRVR